MAAMALPVLRLLERPSRMKRIDPKLRQALEETGLPWEVVNGGIHFHVRLDGRLVGILPRGGGAADPRALRNTIAQVRRAARQHHPEGA